jgi:hypothetical protein
MAYSEKIDVLFTDQFKEWELAKVNYELLAKVKTKKIDFDGYAISVQFNPERIRSSAAKVDAKSIEARPCFLCAKNRPAVQRGVDFEDGLTILINPFPIFNRHLTIPSQAHVDQRISPNFNSMLNLAKALPDYIIFYNGPQCGASAPDHFHFQAGNKGFLPVENDFEAGKKIRLLSTLSGTEIWHWNGYGRGMVTLTGNDQERLGKVFSSFYEKFAGLQPDKPEPMLNILAGYYHNEWRIHLIPRKIHRPRQFFHEGANQILLSPASVDLGGIIITPREEDFYKISKNDIADIFGQVCLADEEMPGFFNEIIKGK